MKSCFSCVVIILAVSLGASCSNAGADRFVGEWHAIKSSDKLSIAKDGDRFVIRHSGQVFMFEAQGNFLRGDAMAGEVGYIESSGNLTWRGMELERLLKSPLADGRLPSDLVAAPSQASRTSSGIATLVVERGWGEKRPVASDTVRIDLASFYANTGSMAQRTSPPKDVTVSELPAGLAEGIRLMVAGETRRMWIPGELGGLQDISGGEPGPIVADVRLIGILPPVNR